MIGYKVTEVIDGKFFSSNQSADRGGVWYEKGQWTVPQENCGPLVLFKTIEAARRYRNWLPAWPSVHREPIRLVVWKVQYDPSIHPEVFHCHGCRQFPEEIELVICHGKLKGTVVLADRIKLLVQVQP